MPARRTIKVWTGHSEPTRLTAQEAAHPHINRLRLADEAFHAWYRFVLSFPPHLVATYLGKLGADPRKHCVLDPFCGTGTTLVEAKKLGYQCVGIEANPVPALAAGVKTDWDLEVGAFSSAAKTILRNAQEEFKAVGLPEYSDLPLFQQRGDPLNGWSPPESILKLIPRGIISPLPLRRALILHDKIDRLPDTRVRNALKVALAACLVEDIGNVGFGPEIYATRPKVDVPVIDVVTRKISGMVEDLHAVNGLQWPKCVVYADDARELTKLPDRSVDVVITSPPYPNEKDYTRTTRLETVLLGFAKDRDELRGIKRRLLRSNTRGVYRDDQDHLLVTKFSRILQISRRIEERRIELRKNSGFERMYHRVVLLYFGGMKRHLESLKRVLRRGAKLAYVVGDQMSYLMVPIQTGVLLAEIAEASGYKVEGIDLWRTRLSTTSGVNLREEVVRLGLP